MCSPHRHGGRGTWATHARGRYARRLMERLG